MARTEFLPPNVIGGVLSRKVDELANRVSLQGAASEERWQVLGVLMKNLHHRLSIQEGLYDPKAKAKT